MMKRVSTQNEKFVFTLTRAGFCLSTALILSGCSGGGASLQQPSISQPTNNTGFNDRSATLADSGKIDPAALKAPRVGVYLTASKSADGFAHIWAPILKVEVIDDKASAQTIWDGGADGIVVDLNTLAAGSSSEAGGKFLGIVGAPVNGDKATERIRVTFGNGFEMYAPGAAVAKTTVFGDSVARDSEGHPIISFALAKPRNLGSGKENVVIDVDLSNLNIKNDKMTPVLREGDQAGLKETSHIVETTYTGTVNGISADGLSSKFALASNQTASPAMIVLTSAGTILYNDGTAPNAVIADKERVRVKGILAPDSKRVVASEIAAFASDKPVTGASSLTGTISHVNAEDKTFVVDVAQAEGIRPTQASITVTLAADAVVRSHGGLSIKADDFWSALKAKDSDSLVRVDGVSDPVNGTLSATRVKFENLTPSTTHETDAEGEPKFVDIGAKTFSLAAPLIKWEGIAAPENQDKGLPIAITAATIFTDISGDAVTPAKFFEAATKDKDKVVRVVGLYGAKGTVTATKVVLLPRPAATSPVASASPAPGAAGAAAVAPATGAAPTAASPATGANAATSITAPAPTPTPLTVPAGLTGGK